MTAELGEGRFGPVYLASAPEGAAVVIIRVFDRPMTVEQQGRLVETLRHLCDTPLDHPSIARPLEAGAEDGRPYLVHAYLPGVPVDEYLRTHGRVPFPDVSLRVTHLAAAIDFAAAAGVCHGALGPRDILIAPGTTGVSGFGLAQAMYDAGIETGTPSPGDDIYALAAMTYELLAGERFAGGNVRDVLATLPGMAEVNVNALAGALQSALSSNREHWPSSALQFAGSLHDSLVLAGPPTPVTGPRAAARQEAPEFTGRLTLHEGPPAAEPAPTTQAPRSADLPLFDAPLRPGRLPSRPSRGAVEAEGLEAFPREGAGPVRSPAPAAHVAAYAEVGPAYGDADPSIVESHPAYADPVPAFHAGPPPSRSGEGWLPHPLTVATLTVIVLVAFGAGVFLLGDLGSGILSPSFVTGESDPAGEAQGPADLPQEPDPQMPLSGPDLAAASPPVLVEPGLASPGIAPEVIPEERVPGQLPQPDRPPGSTDSSRSPAAPVAVRPGASPGAAGDRQTPVLLQGRVLVRSNPPGARVLVDDQLRGETPVAIRGLSFGTHTITVTAPGFPTWQREVTLTAERPSQSFEIALGRPDGSDPAVTASIPAMLQVDSRPSGAQVWVDGRLMGTTPLQLPGVEAGSYEVRLELPGYRSWTTSISVGGGERTRVAASLEQQ